MAGLPAWIGWPGTGPAPGHDWLPGLKLRFTILLLTYAFLALALTVNYAYSVTFFLLAIIGMYVGFRRGFVSGLTRAEKLMMVAFAAYPAVAILSYLYGTQTNVGFRFLGRDLRLLLFIPIYLALRWSRPSRCQVGYALAGGAALASLDAIVEVARRGVHFHARGVAGVAISFGDLALLTGLLGALVLVGVVRDSGQPLSAKRNVQLTVGSAVGTVAGLTASALSQSRGGWLAVPVLLVLLLARSPVRPRAKLGSLLLLLAIGVGILAPIHGLRDIAARAQEAWTQFHVFLTHPYDDSVNGRLHSELCPDDPSYLRELAAHTQVAPTGSRARLRLVPDGAALSGAGWLARCQSGVALRLDVPARSVRTWLAIPRSLREPGRQVVSILARGEGEVWVLWPGKVVRVDSSHYRVYTVSGWTGRRSYLHVGVRPGRSLYFVPLQDTFGEYTFVLDANAVGERFALWMAAVSMFSRHPWLGVGAGGFRAHARELVNRHRASPVVWPYQHAHSDYMNRLACTGIVGLASLLLLYAAPVLGRRSGGLNRTAGAGLTVVAGMAIFGLTETMFVHSLVISWVTVVVAAVMALANDRVPRRDSR